MDCALARCDKINVRKNAAIIFLLRLQLIKQITWGLIIKKIGKIATELKISKFGWQEEASRLKSEVANLLHHKTLTFLAYKHPKEAWWTQ